jgi:hypothetical protein
MFDTPDLGPLCVAPFIAIIVGVLFYGTSWAINDLVASKISKKRDWLRKVSLLLAISIVPIVCWASVLLDIGVREPSPWFTPRTKDIVGTWALTADNIAGLETWNHIPVQDHEFVFNSDNTFHVTNIPTFWGLWDDKNKIWNARYMSGSGTWYLGQVQGTQRLEWVIFVQFEEMNGQKISIAAKEKRLVRFYFVGHLPPYMLRSLDGDMGFDFRKK